MPRLKVLGVLLLVCSGCATAPSPQSKPEAVPTADIGPAVQGTVSAQATIGAAVNATVQAIAKPTQPTTTPIPTEAPATPKPADPTSAAAQPQVVVVVPPAGGPQPGESSGPVLPGFWTVCVWCDHGTNDPRTEAERVAGQLRAAGMPAAILWSSDYASLNPGYWVTYSGVFDNNQAAAAHLNVLSRAGITGRVRWVSTRAGGAPGSVEQPYWTTIVGSSGSRGEAEALAARLRAQGLAPLILFSSDYSSLNPGFWVAHVGRFSDQASAEREAQRLRGLGFSGAYPREIRR